MFLLDDKVVFARIISSYDLPHPRIFSYTASGTPFTFDGAVLKSRNRFDATLQQCGEDLVLKPTYGSGGQAVYRIRRSYGGLEIDGVPFTFERYCELARRGDWLIQMYVTQSPDLARPHPSSLNSLRLMTLFVPGDGARVLFGMMKMGVGGALTDNAHTHGIYARVDLNTGRVGDCAFDEELREYLVHPSSDVEISSISVPDIEAICALAERCANLFPSIPLAGWDVAHTVAGPVVLEGNSSPGLTIIQRTHAGMVGEISHYVSGKWAAKLGWPGRR